MANVRRTDYNFLKRLRVLPPQPFNMLSKLWFHQILSSCQFYWKDNSLTNMYALVAYFLSFLQIQVNRLCMNCLNFVVLLFSGYLFLYHIHRECMHNLKCGICLSNLVLEIQYFEATRQFFITIFLSVFRRPQMPSQLWFHQIQA